MHKIQIVMNRKDILYVRNDNEIDYIFGQF